MKKILFLSLILLPLFSLSQKKIEKDSLNILVFEQIKVLEKQINDTFPILERVKLDSIKIDSETKKIDIFFNRNLSFIPIRENTIKILYAGVKKSLAEEFVNYKLNIFSKGREIELFLPNFYRKISNQDKSRLFKKSENRIPIVRNISKNFQPTKGLYNQNIALWHSHGWYYEPKLDRWEWQRARILQTVEDLYTMSYVLPYLAPMLENAGASIFLPKERDFQTHEIVMDNTFTEKQQKYLKKIYKESSWGISSDSTGFKQQKTYKENENPFKLGTYRFVKVEKKQTTKINWLPTFVEAGEYGVYISYKTLENSVTDAHYTVYHLGGKTEFLVNQQMGGGTWIYLGKFQFAKGLNSEMGKVELTNQSAENGIVTADAIRFGGGMGNVSRNGKIGERPRFVEAARYYLQYAGMDSAIYDAGKNEIWDDVYARGKWVNYLKGSFYDSTNTQKGLNIPIDMAFSFHTDAGLTRTDSVIGTLAIFDTKYTATHFPDGVSRFASRDLADLLQTQIVDDIRAKYNKSWTRRGLWDKEYGGARIASVPTVLLELLSHQNLEDMIYGQNPQFRFDVSRSIYKAFLKFLSIQNGVEFVVQPLPVSHFQTEFEAGNSVLLKWKPVMDSLESTAVAEKYRVYIRKGNNDFDNGRVVQKEEFLHENIEKGVIYSYKVTALNSGGESFPSEILSACKMDNEKPTVLIVNAFDRISAPEFVNTKTFKGFANFLDAGVPDKYDLHFTGNQHDFDPNSDWLDDDSPGVGASHANFETQIIAGNTFDFPFIHGKAIKSAGYSFVSSSDEAISDEKLEMTDYKIVDFIFGEEKETLGKGYSAKADFKVFPSKLKKQIELFCESGGNIFLSGAYLGTDLTTKPDKEFAKNTLKYKWRTNHADVVGEVYSINNSFYESKLNYNTKYNSEIYAVEAPDAIEPADEKAKTLLRYSSNNMSAAVAYKDKYGVVILGFPFETILSEKSQNSLMHSVLQFFESK